MEERKQHVTDYPINLTIDGVSLHGNLDIPADAQAVVVFVNDPKSARYTLETRELAHVLQQSGIATLVTNYLSPDEQHLLPVQKTAAQESEIISRRLIEALDVLSEVELISHLPLVLFATDMGGVSLFRAVAERPSYVKGVVVCSGALDLVSEILPSVYTPTLVVYGENDVLINNITHQNLPKIPATHDVRVIPGATHMLEEEGALAKAGEFTSEWIHRLGGATQMA